LIVYVHGLRNWGAVEEYVAALVRAAGDEAVLLYPDDPVLAPFAELGGRPFDLDAQRLTVRLARTLRALRPEIVHVTDVFPQALLAARLAGVKRVVVTHHTPELPRRDNFAGRIWNRLGWATRPHVIYTSEADRRRDGRPRAHVIERGIDLDRFKRGRPALEGVVVGNVARLAEQKGQRDLIAAARAVLERHPDARFVVAGDGELRAELEALARPLDERFTFLGERDDVPDLLASFDVFAYPSRFEGLCLAVIEAQAAGVPVVATPVGGIVENVVDGETGLLVPPNDPAALADAILRLLDEPELGQRLAERARLRVLERYARERMVERTLALYDSIRYSA
jgi:glycosyltransferase involved in cell wall biosynthesis